MIDRASHVDPTSLPSGTGCLECEGLRGWWIHLRRCTACGHIGCCDDSLSRHATAHVLASGHTVVQSFEPDEDWFWDYAAKDFVSGEPLAGPQHHPLEQVVPGPASRVPLDWQAILQRRQARYA